MATLRKWLKMQFSKNFIIELEDKYCYPNEKAFCMPTTAVMCEAIEKYSVKAKDSVTFISREKPIVFALKNGQKYTATLEMGYARANSGYHIMCKQMLEEAAQ